MYENYKDLAKRIRKNCLHMVHVGQSGHIGSMLSAADIMAVLYGGGFVKVDPKNPKAPDRDRFIMSKGHAGAVASHYWQVTKDDLEAGCRELEV